VLRYGRCEEKRTLVSVNENGLRDDLVGGDLLDDLVVGGLVNNDGVVGLSPQEGKGQTSGRRWSTRVDWGKGDTDLVLYLSLRPLLLLLGLSNSGGGFSFGRLEERRDGSGSVLPDGRQVGDDGMETARHSSTTRASSTQRGAAAAGRRRGRVERWRPRVLVDT
jgi:hypothetical protein